jgi:hypothetical protein
MKRGKERRQATRPRRRSDTDHAAAGVALATKNPDSEAF